MPEGFGIVSFENLNLNFEIQPPSTDAAPDASAQDPTAPDATDGGAVTSGAAPEPPPTDPTPPPDATDPSVTQDATPDAAATDPALDFGSGQIVVGELPVMDHVAHFAGGDWVAL
jgi:hypothetical protein